jgi:hypothetical protein
MAFWYAVGLSLAISSAPARTPALPLERRALGR